MERDREYRSDRDRYRKDRRSDRDSERDRSRRSSRERDKDYKRSKTSEKDRNERHARDTRKNEKRSSSRRYSSKQDVIQLSDGSSSDGGVEIVSDEENLDIDIDEDSDEEAIIERRRQYEIERRSETMWVFL